jgi:hypothetical protein
MKVDWTICERVRCEHFFRGAFDSPRCKINVPAWTKLYDQSDKVERGHPYDKLAVDRLMNQMPDECPFGLEMTVSEGKP